MEKLSIFKRLRLFKDYKILIKRNKQLITDKTNGLNLRIDRVGRIYTVFSCPADVRQYGSELAEKYIKEYIGKVDVLFVKTNLSEYVGIREITQIEGDELDFLIIFGFKGFNTAKYYQNLMLSLFFTIASISAYLFFFY
tara:strand:+ start:44000 stop:44416 length:417 start_codon:yes stop_codon:yes gene_type:complete